MSSVITNCIFLASDFNELEPLGWYGGDVRRCVTCGKIEYANGCRFYGGRIEMCSCGEPPLVRMKLRSRLLNAILDFRIRLARWILPNGEDW
jgi:hypothetical protein